MPLVGTIASGNTVLIKPSELSLYTSEVLKTIIEDTFDRGFVDVVLGDTIVAAKVLEKRFDMIFFTGSTQIGKIVMASAAKNLTPVILELGGNLLVL